MRWQWEDLSVAWYAKFWLTKPSKGECGFLNVDKGIYSDVCLFNKFDIETLWCEIPPKSSKDDKKYDGTYLFNASRADSMSEFERKSSDHFE